jgi:predicted  nucleic acid-binding Zn-ribbon protein
LLRGETIKYKTQVKGLTARGKCARFISIISKFVTESEEEDKMKVANRAITKIEKKISRLEEKVSKMEERKEKSKKRKFTEKQSRKFDELQDQIEHLKTKKQRIQNDLEDLSGEEDLTKDEDSDPFDISD